MINIETDIVNNPHLLQVFDNELKSAINDYVSDVLGNDPQKVNESFNRLILHIHNTCLNKCPSYPSASNIPMYEYLFRVYLSLCITYDRLPTIGIYCLLVGLNPLVVEQMIYNTSASYKGNYDNSYLFTMFQNINAICKSMTIDRLHNMRGTDANLIFVSKACYGLTETVPTQTIEHRHISSLSDIANSIGIDVSEN